MNERPNEAKMSTDMLKTLPIVNFFSGPNEAVG